MPIFEKRPGAPAGNVRINLSWGTFNFGDGQQITVTDFRAIDDLQVHPFIRKVPGTEIVAPVRHTENVVVIDRLDPQPGDVVARGPEGWEAMPMETASGSPGPPGAEGPQGLTGQPGPTGPTGLKGDRGDGGPMGSIGPIGNSGPVGPAGPVGPSGATGSSGSQGTQGPTGAAVLNGSGVPSAGTGANGDFYINVAADTIYGPKTAGAWGSATPLIGPTGPAGTPGPAGATGNTGGTGPAGATGGLGPTGAQGPIGNTGPAGAQGPAGAAVAIGALATQSPPGTLLGVYRSVVGPRSGAVPNAAAINSIYVIQPNAGSLATGAGSAKGVFWLDPSDYILAAMTAKLRTRLVVTTNAVTSVATYTLGLYPVTGSAGAAAAEPSLTLGPVVAGSTAVRAAPASNTRQISLGVDFNVPAAGAYVLAVAVSAAIATAAIDVTVDLEQHWV